jgi:hypothetical protein
MKQIETAVFVREEAGGAVVAALHDVQRNTGKHEARAAGHGRSTGRRAIPLTSRAENVVCP